MDLLDVQIKRLYQIPEMRLKHATVSASGNRLLSWISLFPYFYIVHSDAIIIEIIVSSWKFFVPPHLFMSVQNDTKNLDVSDTDLQVASGSFNSPFLLDPSQYRVPSLFLS